MSRDVYIFRINYEEYKDKIIEEAMKERLRQGWGASNMDISDNYCLEDFKRGWEDKWGKATDEESISKIKNKYRNLKIMLEFKKGDLLVIPKVRDNNHFMIAEVKDNYYFDKSEDIFEDATYTDDFRHIIPVKVKQIINYFSCEDSIKVKSKFKSYRSPVNRVKDEEIISLVENMVL